MPYPAAYGQFAMGLDPEFFFLDKKGEVFPADKLLPPARKAKEIFRDAWGTGTTTREQGTVHAHFDGLQGELTIKESFCRQWLAGRVREGVRSMYVLAKKKRLSISISPCEPTPKKILNKASEAGRLFGCEVDYISWLDGRVNPLLVDPDTHFHRYCGGHIHLGFLPDALKNGMADFLANYNIGTKASKIKTILTTPATGITTIKLMDYLVGNTMVLLDNSDKATMRRQVYGKAGVYRTPAHGVEYRTLSNFYLVHPAILNFVLALSREVVSILLCGKAEEILAAVDPVDIIVAINTNDTELAMRNWRKIRKALEATGIVADNDLISGAGDSAFTNPLKAFEVVSSIGINNLIDPDDVKVNWKLGNDSIADHEDELIPSWRVWMRTLAKDKAFKKAFASAPRYA